MCNWSKEFASRRANQGEDLIIVGPGARHKMAAPSVKEAGVECVCLKTGDRVQFCDLPKGFQLMYAVPANAVAVFTEAEHNTSDRDRYDRFDFLNTVEVSMANMPRGAKLNVLELVDQPRNEARPAEKVESERQLIERAGELVVARNQIRGGVAVLALVLVAMVGGLPF